jgi:hypothetical protein
MQGPQIDNDETSGLLQHAAPEAFTEDHSADSRDSARFSEPGNGVGHARPESSSWGEVAEEAFGEANHTTSTKGHSPHD